LRSSAPKAKTSSDFYLEGLAQFVLVPIQVIVACEGSEVVAMHNDRHVALWMVEGAWVRDPGDESNGVEDLSIAILP
jgi:hypothetical protein